MNWDDMRFFLAVARTGKVTEAGKRLGVDQATVGRRIHQLEQRLQAMLFDKSPRGYELTETGQRFLPFAEDMESKAEEAREAIAGQTKQLSGAVRIGAPEGVASHLISVAAADLCRRNPDLEVQLVALPRAFSLSKREVDFAVSVSRPTGGRVKVRKIADYELHVYAAPAYLARHPVERLEDAKRRRGVGYISDLIFDRELDYIPLIDPAFAPRLTSTSLWVQLEWTRQGAGLCVLPDFIARRHPDLVRVLPNDVGFVRTFWLLTHEDNAGHDRIRRCADAVADAVARPLAEIAAENAAGPPSPNR